MAERIHITDDGRRGRLVARHHLGRTAGDAEEAVRGLTAAHSSDPLTPYLAAWGPRAGRGAPRPRPGPVLRPAYAPGVDTSDLIAVVEAESARFLEVLRDADLGERVSSCPDWDGADLAWHLAEVQGFWGDIVGRLLEDPEDHDRPERPPDEGLLDLFAESSAALVSALRERDPGDRCWTWHPDGETVGWVARRQAHEALIHRVDAEQTAGERVTDADPTLADDGVDEVVRVMIDGLPPWATFTPDGDALTIVADDADGRWNLEFGRFTGRGPDSRRLHDLDAARVIDERPTDTTIAGQAWDLDLWLWGRGGDAPLAISGDVSLVDRLRDLAVEAAQ